MGCGTGNVSTARLQFVRRRVLYGTDLPRSGLPRACPRCFPHAAQRPAERLFCIFSMWKSIGGRRNNFRHLWCGFGMRYHISGAVPALFPLQLSTGCGKAEWKNCIRGCLKCIFGRTSVFQQQFSTACGFLREKIPRFFPCRSGTTLPEAPPGAPCCPFRFILRVLLTFVPECYIICL